MKVVQIGPYPPPQGGVQSNICAIRKYLLEHGHHCAVFNITSNRSGTGEAVYHPRNAWQLLRLLVSFPADVLHLHIGIQTGSPFASRLILLGWVITLLPGRKTVFTFHSGGFSGSVHGKRLTPASLLARLFRRFDFNIGVNDELVALFRRLGVPESRSRKIYPHALAPPRPGVEIPAVVREFLNAHSPTLLFVGLLETEYDLGLQIDALGAVRERYPNAGLLLVGSGSLELELRRRIAAHPLGEHFLLAGDMPHEVTLHIMVACDALLRTTVCDGDSVAVREALFLRLPVIATDNGMRPDGVRLIPVGGSAELRATILALLADPPMRQMQTTPDDSNIAEVVRIYEELLKDR